MSSMSITVGGYTHSIANRNMAWFSERREERLSPRGRRMWVDVLWVMRTVLQADDPAGVTTAIQTLRAAHVNGADITVYDSTGAATAHSLISANTMNGTRFLVQEFPYQLRGGMDGPGVEYLNKRVVKTYVRAEISSPEDTIISYEQSVRQVAFPVPDFVIQEGFFLPVRQDTIHQGKVAIVQSGQAVGLLDYPTHPPSLWPASMKPRPFLAEFGTPRKQGALVNTLYPIRWSYYHEGAGGLIVFPPPIF